MTLRQTVAPATLLALTLSLLATEPNDATRRWWSHIVALSGDDLQGRDTGSEGYRKAAQYVVTQFERAGLKAAGEHAYYQTVPLHDIRLIPASSTAELVRTDGVTKLQWLHQLTIRLFEDMPDKIDTPLVFAGTGDAPSGFDANGKLVVSLNGYGPAKSPEGLLGNVSIDDPHALEPPRWPLQYAVSMRLAETAPSKAGPLAIRFNPAEADLLFTGSRHT